MVKCPHCNGTGDIAAGDAHVGTVILSTRKERCMTQEELAGRVGLSRPQIANIESGRSDMPLSRLRKFADAFGVSMKELVP